MKVGFIGLGLMGEPMAKNILKKGFPLVVYNRTKEKTLEIASLGAIVANSPAELASQVDVIVTMITAGKDVESVLLGDKGVVHGTYKDLTVIDMSTIGPTAAKQIAARLTEKQIAFLDAPVTGSTPKAISGELTIFVGGESAVLEKVRPILEAMGKTIIPMGTIGSGQAIKLINNFLIASFIEALSEGMLIADKLGLQREKVADALIKTPNLSPTLQMKLSNYVKDNFDVMFSMANMRKDVGLALFEMKKSGENLPELTLIESLYEKANETELSQKDFSAIIKILK